MFKQEKYDPRTISVFEILSSYVANLFYHHFYNEAEKMKVDQQIGSVTDGYPHVVRAYISSLNKPLYYKRSIIGIHQYYQNTTRFTNIPMKDCLNDIIRQFIPDEYFESMNTNQRETILHNVLIDAVSNFASELMSTSLLVRVIDNHRDPDTAVAIKQKIMDCLLFEREKVYRKFFTTLADPKNKNPQRDMKLSTQLKQELSKMLKINGKLSAKVDNYRDKLDDAKQIIADKNKVIASFKSALRETHSKLTMIQDDSKTQDITVPLSRPHISVVPESEPEHNTVVPELEHNPVVPEPEHNPVVPEPEHNPVVPEPGMSSMYAEDLTTNPLIEHVQPSDDVFFGLSGMD